MKVRRRSETRIHLCRHSRIFPEPFLEGEGGGGGGTGGGSGSGGAGGQGSQSGGDKAPSDSAAQNFLARFSGNAVAAILYLMGEGHDNREEIRTLKTKLRDSQVPEGGRVLTKDEAALWEAYKGLGKPDDLQKLQQEKTAVEQKLQGYEEQSLLEQVAKIGGLKVKAVKRFRVKEDGTRLGFAVREVDDPEGDGKVKAVFVKDGDKEVSLDKYLEEGEWAEYADLLLDQDGDSGDREVMAERSTYRSGGDDDRTGTRFPGQTSRGRGSRSRNQDPLDGYLNNTYIAPRKQQQAS